MRCRPCSCRRRAALRGISGLTLRAAIRASFRSSRRKSPYRMRTIYRLCGSRSGCREFISLCIFAGWQAHPGCAASACCGPEPDGPGGREAGAPFPGAGSGPCGRWIWRCRISALHCARWHRFQSCTRPDGRPFRPYLPSSVSPPMLIRSALPWICRQARAYVRRRLTKTA